jgi:hypothetical protein
MKYEKQKLCTEEKKRRKERKTQREYISLISLIDYYMHKVTAYVLSSSW